VAGPFALELGMFDPTFPGVTLHFPNEATWRKSQEVTDLTVRLLEEDARLKLPGASATGPTMALLLERFMGKVFANPGSPEEREAVGRQFIASDPENAVGNLAIASAFAHERRHFHDWLLSPYAAGINAMRSEIYANYSYLRFALRASGTTVIPVPLPRWLRKSPTEQQELVKMWQALLGDATPIRLPDLTRKDLLDNINTIARRYRSIGVLFEPVGFMGVDAAAIFEASALLIQIQNIHDLFGETASNLFGNAMANVPPPNRYGVFLKTMSGLAKPGEVLENNTLTAIATWCLLGNSTADNANAHPLLRFTHAVECVQARGLSSFDKPTAEIFDDLDRMSGVMPYRKLVKQSIKLGDEVVKMLNKAAMQDRSGSKFLLGIAQAQEYLHYWHTYMARRLLTDPDSYCQPAAYLDLSPGDLPEPPLRETFGRPFRFVERTALGGFSSVNLFEDASTPEQACLQQTIMQLPGGVVDLQIADNWQYLSQLADTLFAEYNRDKPEIEAEKVRALRSGLRYLEMLN
jgi:hypothetical protein